MSSRRDFLKMAAAAAAGCVLPKNSTAKNLFRSPVADIDVNTAKGSLPNIIFLHSDDLGYADLGCMGSDLHLTPNLDQLKSQSLWFTNAYSTQSTCAPSRLGINTGKYPARLGVVNNSVDDVGALRGQYTLAQALKAQGYQTCHIGKWHIGNGDQRPEHRGFDISIGSNNAGMPSNYFAPWNDIPDLEEFPNGSFLTDCLTEMAVRYIKDHKSRPFFMHFCFYSVHTPIQSTDEKRDKYQQIIDQATTDLRHDRAKYAGLVEHQDDNVGRVLQAIEEEGISDNTIIVFISDNGGIGTDNYPMRSIKGTAYEGGTRVPMFVKWPSVTTPGDSCDVPMIGMDLYPTFISMAKSQVSPLAGTIDGVDLVPFIKKQVSSLDRDLFWMRMPDGHYNKNKYGVVYGSMRSSDNYKLVEYFPTNDGNQDHIYEMYNLNNDLSETTNLLQNNGINETPAVQQKFDELLAKIRNWRQTVYDDSKFDPPYIDGSVKYI